MTRSAGMSAVMVFSRCHYLHDLLLRTRSSNRKCLLLLGLIGCLLVVHVYLNAVSGGITHSKFKAKVYTNENRIVPLWFNNSLLSSNSSLVTNSTSPAKLIILGYMRSGSTLTGDIMQAHPDVFYVYEPLIYLWDYYVPSKMHIKNDWHRAKQYWKKNKSYIPGPVEFLRFVLNCNLTEYNLGFLTNSAHSKHFEAGKCPDKHSQSHLLDFSRGCSQFVSNKCMESKLKVAKVVRLSMKEADEILSSDPNTRLIHLVRDPRGILLSRMNFNSKKAGEMHNNYTNVCRRIWDDISMSKKLSLKHWGRVLTVRYEDLAQDPLAMTATLYSYVGLELLPSVRAYLERMTRLDIKLPSGHPTAKKTFRKNPFKTAYKWRQRLPYATVQAVDKTCHELYNAMGYVVFDSEMELRDLRVAAKLPNFGSGLMTAWLV